MWCSGGERRELGVGMKVVWSGFVCAMRLGSVVMAMAIAVLNDDRIHA